MLLTVINFIAWERGWTHDNWVTRKPSYTWMTFRWVKHAHWERTPKMIDMVLCGQDSQIEHICFAKMKSWLMDRINKIECNIYFVILNYLSTWLVRNHLESCRRIHLCGFLIKRWAGNHLPSCNQISFLHYMVVWHFGRTILSPKYRCCVWEFVLC